MYLWRLSWITPRIVDEARDNVSWHRKYFSNICITLTGQMEQELKISLIWRGCNIVLKTPRGTLNYNFEFFSSGSISGKYANAIIRWQMWGSFEHVDSGASLHSNSLIGQEVEPSFPRYPVPKLTTVWHLPVGMDETVTPNQQWVISMLTHFPRIADRILSSIKKFSYYYYHHSDIIVAKS